MRDLCECFPQIWLIEVAGVIVEVGVADFLLMLRCPWGIFAGFLAACCCPLLQQRDLFPESISVDLTTKSQLYVEAATFGILLENVFPHKSHSTKLGPVVGADIECEIVAGVSNKPPACFVTASNQELVTCATKVGGNSVGPFGRMLFLHPQVDVVSVEDPCLMSVDGICL